MTGGFAGRCIVVAHLAPRRRVLWQKLCVGVPHSRIRELAGVYFQRETAPAVHAYLKEHIAKEVAMFRN